MPASDPPVWHGCTYPFRVVGHSVVIQRVLNELKGRQTYVIEGKVIRSASVL
jgi:hypothetical protein